MALPPHINTKEVDKFVETSDGKVAVRVNVANNLIPKEYDYITLTYVAAGNGAGEIETATYKTGGAVWNRNTC